MPNKIEIVRNVLYKCFPDQPHSNVNELFEKDKSITFAVDYLRPGELPERTTLVSLVIGTGHAHFGFLWITNHRVFFAASESGLFMKPRPIFKEFRYRDILSVDFERSRRFHSARIVFHLEETEGNKPLTVFESIVANDRLQAFVDYLQNRLANPHRPADESAGTDADLGDLDDSDIVESLERLRNLHEQGAITQEEFEAAKKKLLDL